MPPKSKMRASTSTSTSLSPGSNSDSRSPASKSRSISPTPLRSPPPASSTAASSPPAADDGDDEEEEAVESDVDDEEEGASRRNVVPIDKVDKAERKRRLDYVLEKSALFAQLIGAQRDSIAATALAATPKPKAKGKGKGSAKAKGRKSAAGAKGKAKGKTRAGAKRKRIDTDEEEDKEDEEDEEDAEEGEEGAAAKRARVVREETPAFEQPALLTGATLKDYQLTGVQWMAGLWEVGVSGILADEMGLGKTIQTIAFVAHLRTRATAPFLIVCPLSVLHNWAAEFARFAPKIPICVYHGAPPERRALQAGVLAVPPGGVYDGKGPGGQRSAFPVVLTTYEMVVKDRAFLARHGWGYVVVDEGHRLKNANSRLMTEIKKYPSASRLILTGTPLQNNLAELWSLLNFILPDIFDDAAAFQDWFNLPTLATEFEQDQSTHVITTLHGILRPFLLRRLKADVLGDVLPPKKEYVLYAPLSERQRALYDAVIRKDVRGELLAGERTDTGAAVNAAQVEAEAEQEEEEGGKSRRKARTRAKRRAKVDYNVDGSDADYFRRLEAGEIKSVREQWEEHALAGKTHAQLGAEHARNAKLKKINNLHLRNAVMQLRKVCSHPFLFDWPEDARTGAPVVGDALIDASGKMMVLARLLGALFARGHKVLVFSQFTTMLDIIEDWATDEMGWPVCRIDGKITAEERQAQMARFQSGGTSPSAPKLFLLSTRAGGLGVNLTAADTVVFFDQDWNPQADIQAQDRAHRIGQTRPVLVFRLVTKHTIESKIMQRAGQKRQLEALVIAKGKFKMPLEAGGDTAAAKRASMAELASSLLELEGEKIEVVPDTRAGRASVLSDAALEKLLDRSPEVFARRSGAEAKTKAKAKTEREREGDGAETDVDFEEYEAPVDEGNEALAMAMGEEFADD